MLVELTEQDQVNLMAIINNSQMIGKDAEIIVALKQAIQTPCVPEPAPEQE